MAKFERERAFVLGWCLASALLYCSVYHFVTTAKAADYPVKPIKLVVGGTPGGAVDVVARPVAELLASRLKQPVLIENRPGASGAIGARLVAKADPDGYTLFMCNSATHAGNTVMFRDLGYDPVKDFVAIVRIVTAPFILIVNPGLPIRSVNELVEVAKAQPGKLRFGYGGAGGFNHMAGLLFQQQAGIQFLPVAYKGLNEVVTDVAGAHIELGFPTPGESLGLINGGRVRAIAITGPRRLAVLPNVPTVAEAGFPHAELVGWGGLCAPTNTPASIVTMLNYLTLDALLSPSVKPDFERRGYDIVSNTPDEFSSFIKAEISRITEIANHLGIQREQ